MQSAAYRGRDADFAQTVGQIEPLSAGNPVKAMLFYGEVGSKEEPVKLVLTLRHIEISAQ
jgi:hypothetical protein